MDGGGILFVHGAAGDDESHCARLRSTGAAVAVAGDAPEALRLAATLAPSVVVFHPLLTAEEVDALAAGIRRCAPQALVLGRGDVAHPATASPDTRARAPARTLDAAVLDALPIEVAVLDPQGIIIAINEAWRRFASANGGTEATRLGVGMDYLGACRAAANAGDASAASAIDGIAAVLADEAEQFLLEYPCDSPDENRWFLMQVVRARPEGVGVVITHTDITERKQAERAVCESEARERRRVHELEVLMMSTPAAIWVANDPKCERITGNAESYRLLRMEPGANTSLSASRAEVVARPFREYRDGVPVPPQELPMQLAAATGREVRGAKIEFVFDDGEVRHVFGNAAPLRADDGRIVGAVSAFIDVSELRRAEKALQEADRRKDEFLAMLAHELRNPLAPIRNAAQILKFVGGAEPQLQHTREIILRQVEHLGRLVDDLLDVSRITQGKVTLKTQPVDLRAAIAAALDAARPAIDAQTHELHLAVPETPIWVKGDPVRLAQVVGNLLSNAAKYTPRGGRIELEVACTGSDVAVTVRDNGMGIDAELLPHVFELFSQADRSLERSQGGLGVGLTLVRRLVELHQGTVEARSDGVGRGSTFTVRLPRLEVPAGQTTEGAGDTTRRPAGRRVLVVEDSEDAAESLAMLLGYEGHEVQVAHDGPSAIRMAREFVPDVALLDIGLPGMDGYALAAALRAEPKTRSCVLVALTGYGRAEDASRARDSGFDEHLVKPADPGALTAMVAGATGARGMADA